MVTGRNRGARAKLDEGFRSWQAVLAHRPGPPGQAMRHAHAPSGLGRPAPRPALHGPGPSLGFGRAAPAAPPPAEAQPAGPDRFQELL